MRILGIDPGSQATGFGVVKRDGTAVAHVAHGTLRPPRSAPLAHRLAFLQQAMAGVVAEYAPDVVVIEEVFVAASPRSALVLGQARGALLAGLGSAGTVVREVSARAVKQAVAGNGNASKQQVQTMVGRLLALATRPQADAADALAIALCEARASRLAAAGVVPRGRRRRSRVVVRSPS
ncbi:MAG: crossover junction endodeoxyribonuclease RuvC [Proteobacteria bacterium]|nr:crossover junction endodeoxyribonuclease RuvC [Pseudomonadota bacterium]